MQTQTTQSTADCRPGERLIAGRVAIQDQGLLNLHVAHEAVLSAPAILAHQSYDQLCSLVYAAQTVLDAGRINRDALPYALNTRVAKLLLRYATAERATRPEHQRAFSAFAARPALKKAVA